MCSAMSYYSLAKLELEQQQLVNRFELCAAEKKKISNQQKEQHKVIFSHNGAPRYIRHNRITTRWNYSATQRLIKIRFLAISTFSHRCAMHLLDGASIRRKMWQNGSMNSLRQTAKIFTRMLFTIFTTFLDSSFFILLTCLPCFWIKILTSHLLPTATLWSSNFKIDIFRV